MAETKRQKYEKMLPISRSAPSAKKVKVEDEVGEIWPDKVGPAETRVGHYPIEFRPVHESPGAAGTVLSKKMPGEKRKIVVEPRTNIRNIGATTRHELVHAILMDADADNPPQALPTKQVVDDALFRDNRVNMHPTEAAAYTIVPRLRSTPHLLRDVRHDYIAQLYQWLVDNKKEHVIPWLEKLRTRQEPVKSK